MSDHQHQNDICIECQKLLVEVRAEVGMINKSLMKIVYAMVGLMSGQIGTEFFKKQFMAVSTAHANIAEIVTPIGEILQPVPMAIEIPWYLYAGIYSAMCSGVFVILCLWEARKNLARGEKAIYILFCLALFYGNILRLYFYGTHSPLPPITGILSNLMYVSISLALAVRAWQLSDLPYRWFKKDRRKTSEESNRYACPIEPETG